MLFVSPTPCNCISSLYLRCFLSLSCTVYTYLLLAALPLFPIYYLKRGGRWGKQPFHLQLCVCPEAFKKGRWVALTACSLPQKQELFSGRRDWAPTRGIWFINARPAGPRGAPGNEPVKDSARTTYFSEVTPLVLQNCFTGSIILGLERPLRCLWCNEYIALCRRGDSTRLNSKSSSSSVLHQDRPTHHSSASAWEEEIKSLSYRGRQTGFTRAPWELSPLCPHRLLWS